jgi:hypothetical protein
LPRRNPSAKFPHEQDLLDARFELQGTHPLEVVFPQGYPKASANLDLDPETVEDVGLEIFEHSDSRILKDFITVSLGMRREIAKFESPSTSRRVVMFLLEFDSSLASLMSHRDRSEYGIFRQLWLKTQHFVSGLGNALVDITSLAILFRRQDNVSDYRSLPRHDTEMMPISHSGS